MRSALAAPHLPRHGPPPACRALITAGSTQSAHLDREISAPGRSRSDNEPDNDRANTPTTTPIGGLFYLSSPRPRRHRQRLRGAGLPRRRPHRTAGVRHVRRGVRGLGAGLDADGGARARRARRDGRNPGGGTEGGRGGESMMLPIAEPGSRPSFTPIDTIPTYSGVPFSTRRLQPPHRDAVGRVPGTRSTPRADAASTRAVPTPRPSAPRRRRCWSLSTATNIPSPATTIGSRRRVDTG